MKRILCLFICFVLVMSITSTAYADSYNIDEIMTDTADYIYTTLDSPGVSSVGGEWAILGLARSGEDIPKEYFEQYYKTVEDYVLANNGILHNKKYTEYSRVIVALTAIGKNPKDVAGYNLLTPLGDYEKTIRQGINGAIWALIALDCGNYEMPINTDAKIQATRQKYVNLILERQTPDGGWALSGDSADADVTAMALQALSNYQNDESVKVATEKALECLSAMQDENGGFSSYDTKNSESDVQVIVALCELGISIHDQRFVKNGNTIVDNLITFYEKEKGFKHTDSANQMATEQCLYALVALKRAKENKNSLYDMNDVISKTPKRHNILKPALYSMAMFKNADETLVKKIASTTILNSVISKE